MLRSRFLIVFMMALFTVNGCSSTDEKDPELQILSMEELYNDAQEELQDGNYQLAIAKLEALVSRFPFGNYAESAELNLMYAHLQNDSPELAVNIADRFIRLHPDYPHADYAYYMRGLANYYAGFDLMARFLPGDAYKRDMGVTKASFQDFYQLITLYPNSPYVTDARARMIHLRNTMAAHEVYIAAYYMRRQTYVAALNRATEVVNHYQETPAVQDALVIMTECYYRLGMNELGDNTKKILVANYPDNPNIDAEGNFVTPEMKGNTDKSWLNIISFGLFG